MTVEKNKAPSIAEKIRTSLSTKIEMARRWLTQVRERQTTSAKPNRSQISFNEGRRKFLKGLAIVPPVVVLAATNVSPTEAKRPNDENIVPETEVTAQQKAEIVAQAREEFFREENEKAFPTENKFSELLNRYYQLHKEHPNIEDRKAFEISSTELRIYHNHLEANPASSPEIRSQELLAEMLGEILPTLHLYFEPIGQRTPEDKPVEIILKIDPSFFNLSISLKKTMNSEQLKALNPDLTGTHESHYEYVLDLDRTQSGLAVSRASVRRWYNTDVQLAAGGRLPDAVARDKSFYFWVEFQKDADNRERIAGLNITSSQAGGQEQSLTSRDGGIHLVDTGTPYVGASTAVIESYQNTVPEKWLQEGLLSNMGDPKLRVLYQQNPILLNPLALNYFLLRSAQTARS